MQNKVRIPTLYLHLAFLVFFSQLSKPIYCQELPYLRQVSLDVTVNYDNATGIFSYSYTVKNELTSAGKVDAVNIDISRGLSAITLDTIGLGFKSAFIRESFERNYPRLADRIVPVGFPSLPRYWIGALTDFGEASFFGQYIEPGELVSGLVMTSKGIPAIRTFVAEPQDISDLYPSVDEVSSPDSLLAKIDSDREAIKFRGLTVGPTAPPANLVAIIFLDTLISYKHQAFDLGWIKNQGIVTSLDQKLDNARRQLERGNKTAAKNILQAFVNEVEAQKEKHLTSEAYALLKFNAEYLISKL